MVDYSKWDKLELSDSDEEPEEALWWSAAQERALALAEADGALADAQELSTAAAHAMYEAMPKRPVESLTDEDCLEELLKMVEYLQFDDRTCAIMHRVRRAMDDGFCHHPEDIDRDAGVRLHTAARSAFTFRPNTPAIRKMMDEAWQQRGVAEHLLRDLPVLSEAQATIRAKFPFGLPALESLHEAEAAELEGLYELDIAARARLHRPACDYCKLYLNLVLGSAVAAAPTDDSSCDGSGELRAVPTPGSLVGSAARRVFELWCDGCVRDSVCEAMAPAVSFALTFYEALHKSLLVVQNPRLGADLRRKHAGVYRPCVASVAIACLDDLRKRAYSSAFGPRLLSHFVRYGVARRDGDEQEPPDSLDQTPFVFYGWPAVPLPTMARLVALLLEAVSHSHRFDPPPFRPFEAKSAQGEPLPSPGVLAAQLFDRVLQPAERRRRVLRHCRDAFDGAENVVPAHARAFCARLLRRDEEKSLDLMRFDLRRELGAFEGALAARADGPAAGAMRVALERSRGQLRRIASGASKPKTRRGGKKHRRKKGAARASGGGDGGGGGGA